MAQMIIRNLDDEIKRRLKRRASEHGISMEAEVRQILANALTEEKTSQPGLGSAISSRFEKIGLDQEELPELRGQAISPMDL